MKKGLLLVWTLCAFVSGLSSAQEESKKTEQAVTIFPAAEFEITKATTPDPTNTTTPAPPTTTPAPTNTTTPAPPTTTPAPTTTTTPAPTNTTTLAPTTTTTPAPNTTTTLAPTTTTTPAPNTTTTLAPTTTTTPAPNTTTTLAPTTTTTPAPNTTTTLAPTTHKTTTSLTTTPLPPKPEPTPSANLTVGNYSLSLPDKSLCLMANVALQIKVSTDKTNGTFIVQPKMSKAEGACQKSTANLTITFKEGFITFLYNKNDTEKAVYVSAVSFKLTYAFKSGDSGVYTADNKSVHLFTAAIGRSYSCRSESVNMGSGLVLDVTQDRMQAFNFTNNNFGAPDACPADQPDYRVAIAVGVVLLVLILVVVVAYLLGRRRRTDGYQTL